MTRRAWNGEAFEWTAESRFAIYYAPSRGSAWWDAGCRWLAGDPESGEALEPPLLPALAERSLDVPSLSHAPRRYGWHGTLVAPARRAIGIAGDDIVSHARAWARRQQPFELPVEAAALERFVAIRPATEGGAAAMQALAADALHAFAPLRAMPSEQEQQERRRRLGAALSERQRALLDRWGYPYVLEEFRFHMTLSDSIDAQERQVLIDWWSEHVPKLGPLSIEGAALFVEPRAGEPFALVARLPFGDTQ
ncbi:DUF1045 domain-containing protein [Trinickia dinghuensis]|uniref:DUF1045 domain-containing protein n=1 Tax=Trinickia dinghuensis TaxID=2291023 RepID=A0A3D8JTY6_9BURK|nr:DUF1045 domain-containing protein [Trinickia dinghuensis]RDU96185.1 DUF1045 domain-containing protein [Trinickia dinghuensis]